MTSLSVLHSQGKETKTKLFTKPLRGVLGGRIMKVGAEDKGKKILKVWERVLLGTVLFTVGLPYTAVAGAILMCSKPKNTNISSDSSAAAVKSPIENNLSPEDINALTPLFKGTKIQLKDVEVSKDIFILDLYNLDGADIYLRQAIQLNKPTLTKVASGNTCYDSLVVPVEFKNDEEDWVRSILTAVHHPNDRDQDSCWNIGLDMQPNGVSLPLHNQPNLTEIQPYIDLMKGKVVTFEGKEFRLLTKPLRKSHVSYSID